MQLIKHYDIRPTRTDPNVRTMDFANIFSHQFERYMLVFHGGKSDYNENGFERYWIPQFQFLDEDSAVVSTAVYTSQENGGYTPNTSHQPINYSNNVGYWSFGRFSGAAETAYPIMKFWINNPYENDRITTFHSHTSGHDGSNYGYFQYAAGFYHGVDRFTGFRWTNNTANQATINEGKLLVYGLDWG
tara:strand:+ start:1568 stop:2131 length:564 start_codon:yes stop_codon:yes gene_type:complete